MGVDGLVVDGGGRGRDHGVGFPGCGGVEHAVERAHVGEGPGVGGAEDAVAGAEAGAEGGWVGGGGLGWWGLLLGGLRARLGG